jgi:SAM-dependent methyltransferase
VSVVIWHDLECGRYEQDLSLWHSLSDEHLSDGEALLDVGAGTGRVSLSLARAGHRVVALDYDAELLSELEARAAGLPVQTKQADARTFFLAGRSFPLIIVPMQTIQLLGGPGAHCAFLQQARTHLLPGGIVAVAIAATEDFEEFEWHDGDHLPLPDIEEIGTSVYFSQPTAVRRSGNAFVLERRRQTIDVEGNRTTSNDRIELDILSAEQLEETGREAGLHPIDVLEIAPSEEHIGSQVVILGV